MLRQLYGPDFGSFLLNENLDKLMNRTGNVKYAKKQKKTKFAYFLYADTQKEYGEI